MIFPTPSISQGLDVFVSDIIRNLAVPGESVLIFLPGIGEITDMYETLSQFEFGDSNNNDDGDKKNGIRPNQSQNAMAHPTNVYRPVASSGNLKVVDRSFKLFVLHSVISREEQEEVFNEPEPGDIRMTVLGISYFMNKRIS